MANPCKHMAVFRSFMYLIVQRIRSFYALLHKAQTYEAFISLRLMQQGIKRPYALND